MRRLGRIQTVSPQVFELLRYLIEEHERVVGKDELIERVWRGRIVSDASLSTCVKLARQAIGDDGKRQAYIRTLPRRGYRFVGAVDVLAPERGSPQIMAENPVKRGSTSSDKPALIILPFDNLTGDPAQEHICDGLTETVIAVMSLSPVCDVVARNTAFTFKGTAVEMKEIAGRLGVRFVLEGSVQKSGDTIRVTAQFIDAVEDKHIWAERYDRKLDDIFAVQDDVTSRIVSTIAPTLQREILEHANSERVDTTAADYRARALYHFLRFTQQDNFEARRLAEESIRLEPQFAGGYVSLAWTYRRESEWQWCDNPGLSLQKASAFARKAIALDSRHARAFMVYAITEAWLGRYDSAFDALDRSDELDPNWMDNHAWRSRFLTLTGRHEEAVETVEAAISRFPQHPSWYEAALGAAYFALERYDKAIRLFATATAAFPSHASAWSLLAACQSAAGHPVEAKRAVARLLEISPGFMLKHIAYSRPYKLLADRERFVNALKNAGVPE